MSSLKKNLIYNALLSFSQLALPLLSIPYISRRLDPDGIGRVSFIDSFTYYFISIAEFGIMVYGMREVAKVRHDAKELKKTVSELLLLHIMSSCAAIVLYFIAVYLIWDKIADFRLLICSASLLIINSFACEWYFLGMEKFRFISLRSIMIRLLGLTGIFVLIRERSDYYLYYMIISGTAIINSLANNYTLLREVDISFRNINWKRHLRHTWVTYIISLTYSFTLSLDYVILRLASTATAVGYYAFAMRISRTAGIMLRDSLLVFFPRMVNFVRQNSRQELNAMVQRNIQMIIILGLPTCFGLFLLSDEIISVFLGLKFQPASVDLSILAFYPLLDAYNILLSKQILMSYNKERLFMRNLTVTSIVFVAVCIILSKFYSDRGTCYAVLISELLLMFLNFRDVRRTDPLLQLFDAKTFLQALGCTLMFLPIIYVLRFYFTSSMAIMLTAIAGCAFIYFLALTFVLKNDFAVSIKKNIHAYISKNFRI